MAELDEELKLEMDAVREFLPKFRADSAKLGYPLNLINGEIASFMAIDLSNSGEALSSGNDGKIRLALEELRAYRPLATKTQSKA